MWLEGAVYTFGKLLYFSATMPRGPRKAASCALPPNTGGCNPVPANPVNGVLPQGPSHSASLACADIWNSAVPNTASGGLSQGAAHSAFPGYAAMYYPVSAKLPNGASPQGAAHTTCLAYAAPCNSGSANMASALLPHGYGLLVAPQCPYSFSSNIPGGASGSQPFPQQMLTTKSRVEQLDASSRSKPWRRAAQKQLNMRLGKGGAEQMLSAVLSRYAALQAIDDGLPRGYTLPPAQHLAYLPVADLWIVAEKLNLAASIARSYDISISYSGVEEVPAPEVMCANAPGSMSMSSPNSGLPEGALLAPAAAPLTHPPLEQDLLLEAGAPPLDSEENVAQKSSTTHCGEADSI